MKTVLKAGAIISALVGCWIVYVGIVNFGELPHPMWNFIMVIFQLFLIGLAFAPGFMLIKGYKSKRAQLVFIGVAELIVIGLGLLGMMAFFAEKFSNNQ